MIHRINEAVEYIQSKSDSFQPRFGIILGTGLGSLINDVKIEYSIDYADIPHFVTSTVESHSGKLILGKLEGIDIVVMQGRFHYYEGYDMQEITFPVRVLKVLGIEKLFISNAAGGLNANLNLSDLMVIKDHINLLPENPLRGRNIDELGPRWPDMFECYDASLAELGLKKANELGIPVSSGVYVSVPGPNLETPAEYKYLITIGADAVGMSTVPEVIVAAHMELPCFAVSVITDLCYEGALEPVSIKKILQAAGEAEPKLSLLIKEMIKQL